MHVIDHGMQYADQWFRKMLKVLPKQCTPSGSPLDDQHHLWTLLETVFGAGNLSNVQDSDATDSIVLDPIMSDEDDDLDDDYVFSESSDKMSKRKDSTTNSPCTKRVEIYDEELDTTAEETVPIAIKISASTHPDLRLNPSVFRWYLELEK